MLTAKLILERLDREGRLLERRDQPSRSFTKGLLQLLYVAHAQIQSGSPYSMTDIYGAAQDIDGQGSSSARYSKGNLKIGSPGGLSEVIAWHGAKTVSNVYLKNCAFPGEKVGIQVGRGDTPVTPTDTTMEDRIFHGNVGIEGSPRLYTSYNLNDDEDGHHGIYPDYQEGQSFQVGVPMHLTAVKLKVYRTGSPGNMTVAIQKADANGRPDGVDLGTQALDCDAIAAASPGEWVTWTFATPLALDSWVTYCIVVRGGVNSSNELNWRNDGTTPLYYRGMLVYSSTAGVTWASASGDDYMFEVWGQVEAGEEQIEYGGCELVGLTFSNPNGEFTIRRYFTNNSGSTITVKEVGIYSPGTKYDAATNWAFLFMIAHDIVGNSGIAVADTQVLRVTYVPAITV